MQTAIGVSRCGRAVGGSSLEAISWECGLYLCVCFVFELMDLQSHFATDDRFRMDSRFLESDSEEEQEGKCLIVQTVLMSELGHPEKSPSLAASLNTWRNSTPQDSELWSL